MTSGRQENKEYLTYLEKILESNLLTCDQHLLAKLKSLWKNQSNVLNVQTQAKRVNNTTIQTLEIDLYIADFEENLGPFKFLCLPAWTGRNVRQRIAKDYDFPLEHVRLSTATQVIDDNATLKACGIDKSSGKLFAFVLNKNNVVLVPKNREISEGNLEVSKSITSTYSRNMENSPITETFYKDGKPYSSTWV